MQQQVKQMVEKLEHLSPERLAEVSDFIDFMRQLEKNQLLRNDFTKASEASFENIWNNDEDAIYDDL